MRVDGWSLRDALKRVFTEPDIITEDKLADFEAPPAINAEEEIVIRTIL